LLSRAVIWDLVSGIWDPWDLYDILHEEQINDFPKKIKIKKRIYPS